MFLRHIAVNLFLVIGLMAGISLATASEPPTTKRPPASVKVGSVVLEAISDPIEALGTLNANESVDITVRFAEFIREIGFVEGQRVEQGDILLVLENTEEKALLDEATITFKDAQRQLARVNAIAGRGDASQSLLDERQREYSVAKARLSGIESRLDDHSIKAPFSGLIGLRNISQGAYVAPGDVITTLIDDSAMKVDFSVPSVFLRHLKSGMPLKAITRSFPGEIFQGSVTTLDNRVDPVSRTITVRAVLSNKQGLLKPGLLMEVALLANARNTLLIPEEALVPKSHKQFVMVVEASKSETPNMVHMVSQREVIVGARLRGSVEILSGLKEGETVVIHGADKIRANSQVSVVDDTQQPKQGGN